MEFLFEVKEQGAGAVVVSGGADSEQNAVIAAMALKDAFPEAVVQCRCPNTSQIGGKPFRWVTVVTQSADDF